MYNIHVRCDFKSFSAFWFVEMQIFMLNFEMQLFILYFSLVLFGFLHSSAVVGTTILSPMPTQHSDVSQISFHKSLLVSSALRQCERQRNPCTCMITSYIDTHTNISVPHKNNVSNHSDEKKTMVVYSCGIVYLSRCEILLNNRTILCSLN